MTTQPPPAQVGRPVLPILTSELERLAGLGLSAAMIADRIGVSRRTLFARMETHPEIREAMDRGVSAAVEMAATVLQEEALKGNLQAIVFFLRTRGGYNVPKEMAAPIPQLANDRLAPITLDHVDEMMLRHRALMAVERD